MKQTFILLLSLLLFATVSNGQIGNRLLRTVTNQATNSAEKRANKEVEKKVDKEVNKFIDNLLESDSTKTNEAAGAKPDSVSKSSGSDDAEAEARMNKFMKKLGVSTEIPVHKDLYKFTSQLVTVTEATDEDGKKIDPSESVVSYNEKTTDALFKVNNQDKASTTILDQENKCVIILTESEGQKSGIVTKFDVSAMKDIKPAISDTPEVEGEPAEEECKMAKTGKTKTISGFSCNEYVCETAREKSVAWVTKDRSANLNNIFGNGAMGQQLKTEGLDGMFIQYETYSKTDKSSSIMTIKSIDSNKSSSFSLAGYQLTGLNFGAK